MRLLTQKNLKVGCASKGFTFVEIIMVVVLLYILAVSVVPKFVDTSGFSLEGTAAMVAADIRYAQELAMGNHQSKSITLTTNDTYYRVDSRTVDLPSNATISTGATFTFNSLGEQQQQRAVQ